MSSMQVNASVPLQATEKAADNYKSPDKSELEKMARELHSVGDIKHKKDDYDKRLTALANDYLPRLNKEDQGRFLDTILEQDGGAMKSWLQSDRLDNLVKDGKVSEDNRHTLLDGIASGYNSQHDGKNDVSHLDMDTAWKFFGMDGASKGYVNHDSGAQTQWGGGEGWKNENTSSDIYARMVHGLKGSDGKVDAGFSDFIKNFTTDEIQNGKGKIHGDKYSADHAKDLSVLFNAANQAGDKQKVVSDIFNGLTEKQRATVTEDLSKGFADQSVINDALTNQHKADSSYVDPMTLLIKSVANDGSDKAKATKDNPGTAVELATYVKEHSKNNAYGGNEFYDDKNIPLKDRQEALTELMKSKSSDILEGVNNTNAPADGFKSFEWLTEGRGVLSNMERLTGLAPENKDGKVVLGKIADKTNDWLKNNDGGPGEDLADDKAANTIAATAEAVKQGFADKKEDDEAKKADLMRMIDVITGLVGTVAGPITEKVSSKIDDLVKNTFGDALGEQFKEWGKEGFDKLSDEQKEKVVDKIIADGNQDEYLEAFRDNSDKFVKDELLANVSDDRKEHIMHIADQYSTDVSQDG